MYQYAKITKRKKVKTIKLKNIMMKGFNSLQPLKLYTSAWLTEWMSKRGLPLEVFFTDWLFDGEVEP